MDPVPWMEKLNDAQKEAVQATEGYVRVIAGAGSGKTRVLTYRLAYLVTVLGILPENILSVTFTNKAAGEMRRRIRDLLGENSAALVNTFHGFCVTILREEIHHLFYPNRFLILDVEDQKALLRELYGEMGISARDFSYSEILHEISSRKSNGLYVATVCDPAFQAGPPPSGGEVPDKRAAIGRRRRRGWARCWNVSARRPRRRGWTRRPPCAGRRKSAWSDCAPRTKKPCETDKIFIKIAFPLAGKRETM